MDNVQIYADDVYQRASEDYNPYDYIYELEEDAELELEDIEDFVWDADE
jgi:hypothetical protein